MNTNVNYKDLDRRLITAIPSCRQVEYQKGEFYGFLHFTVNTFTGKEWGTGDEKESIFDPSELDADQWVKTAYEGGMKGVILTCKHHDGFCLWPSQYTEHSVKNSPYKNGKGDIVREVSEACKRYGLKFGVYLSPWDRNHPSYGKGKEYDDYYINQITELLTSYGEIYAFWMDGACGEGKNGKIQHYDWNRYYEKVRELQPNAVLSISGPDVRWCGNEAGMTRKSEWSVVAKRLTNPKVTAELSQQEDNKEFRQKKISATQEDLGSRECLCNEPELAWYPAETDVSIRPGWFYHEEEDEQVRDFNNLKDIYLSSVGGNSTLLLNIPPMKNGKLHSKDISVMRKLGKYIEESFSKNLVDIAQIFAASSEGRYSTDGIRIDNYDTFLTTGDNITSVSIEIKWEIEQKVSYVVLKENILMSQRVESFSIHLSNANGDYENVYDGTVIGYKRIVPLGERYTKSIVIKIKDSRVAPVISFVGVY